MFCARQSDASYSIARTDLGLKFGGGRSYHFRNVYASVIVAARVHKIYITISHGPRAVGSAANGRPLFFADGPNRRIV